MKDLGLDKGLIQFRDDEPRANRGLSKGFFGFRKMFRDYLTKLNVAFFDVCCPELTGDIFPLRYNSAAAEGEKLEYYNGTNWLTIPIISEEVDVPAVLMTYAENNLLQAASLSVIPFISLNEQEEAFGDTGNGGIGFLDTFVYATRWDTSGGNSVTLQGSSQPGQLRKITVTNGGGSTMIVENGISGGSPFTSIVFNSAGAYAVLIAGTVGTWHLIEHNGVTVNA